MNTTRRLNKLAEMMARHPITWLLVPTVLVLLAAFFANEHLKTEARHDRQMSALINLMYQPGGATVPLSMSSGVEMMDNTPKPLFDQLLINPLDMCKMLKCDDVFGSPMDAQSIVTIATAVRDSQSRKEASNGALWANAIAGLSLAISLLTFTLTAARPAVIPE